MLSISKHFVGICALAPNAMQDKIESRKVRVSIPIEKRNILEPVDFMQQRSGFLTGVRSTHRWSYQVDIHVLGRISVRMTQLEPQATYGMTSKARLTVMGLITDKKYSFRAAAVGVVGVGPVCDAVTAKAA